jgi:hypothetical protein
MAELPVPYDPEVDPYDPNDDAAVEAYWKAATILYKGRIIQRGEGTEGESGEGE